MSVTTSIIPASQLFELCGHGDPYQEYNEKDELVTRCGTYKSKGCLEHKDKIFVKNYKINCMRLSCRVCIDRVCSAKAMKATKRIESFKMPNERFNKPCHVIISPPPELEFEKDFSKIRTYAINSLKLVHGGTSRSLGGVLIVHPLRCNEFRSYEKVGLHFHFIGYANVNYKRVAEMYQRDKIYVVKDKGERISTYKTIKYALDHCGISKEKAVKKYKTITWFGCLTYNKKIYRQVEEENNNNKCPECKLPLYGIRFNLFDGSVEPPGTEDGEWITDKNIISYFHGERDYNSRFN